MTDELPLGKATSYADEYSPALLYPLARADSRSALELAGALPFHGVDIWNAWELSWLDARGKPHVAAAEIRIPAESPNIVESKSLKLYLDSFSMSRFETAGRVAQVVAADLGACTGADVEVRLRPVDGAGRPGRLPGHCLDALPVSCDAYDVDASVLAADGEHCVQEDLYSNLLRSLCPVTNQPDCGSVWISYRGQRIAREGLLRYIVSYRKHNDFHEACVERMFVDILERCGCVELTVHARYLRRGGIDINPFRSNFEDNPPNVRLWRQ